MEVRAKKALGQHFLMDQNAARRIVDALSVTPKTGVDPVAGAASVISSGGGSSDLSGGAPSVILTGAERSGRICPRDVLEIGPGMGVLTQYLLQREDIDLKAVELDGESVDYLLTHFPGIQGKLLQADYLKMDMHRVFKGPYRVIGNFPYNISSQIFFKILDDKDRVPEVVCMIQKEVAERIAEKPGSKTYGILSVLLQAWYDIEYLFTVEPGAFAPPPKVRSAVIRLRRNGRTDLGCDEKLFRQVVKTAFNQRRKTLRNSLKELIPQSLRLLSPCTPKGQGEESPCAAPQLTPLSAQSASDTTHRKTQTNAHQTQPPEDQSLMQSPCGESTAGTSSKPLTDSNLTLQQLLDLRAERLSVEDFIRLTNEITNQLR